MKTKQQETINWYVSKFAMKMQGSRKQIAKEWVDGCGQDDETTEKIWNEIELKFYQTEHTYQTLHDDLMEQWNKADDTKKDELGMTELDYVKAELYALEMETSNYILCANCTTKECNSCEKKND